MLQMFFGENRLGVAERGNGEDFTFQLRDGRDFRAHDESEQGTSIQRGNQLRAEPLHRAVQHGRDI